MRALVPHRSTDSLRPALRAVVLLASIGLLCPVPAATQAKPRARELGIPQAGAPGPLNAITDVAGVEVGMTNLIRGTGKLVVGQGPVRTGVTAILPRGKAGGADVYAAWFTLNGNGEMTGTTWVEESGLLGGPVMITNTHSVGVVHAATIEHAVRQGKAFTWSLPVVAETWDGGLNDINGFHVTREHALAAIDGARSGPVPEGNVGGGTGMSCHGFKAGTGTSSRRITTQGRSYTVGVLVQCNYGGRSRLSVAGVPVGEEITDLLPCFMPLPDGTTAGRPCAAAAPRRNESHQAVVATSPGGPISHRRNGSGAALSPSGPISQRRSGSGAALSPGGPISQRRNGSGAAPSPEGVISGLQGAGGVGGPARPVVDDRSGTGAAPIDEDHGSIIVVVVTDAPLLPHQLKRVAKRAALGIGRMGGIGGNSSGDIFIAFSTANPGAAADTGLVQVTAIPNEAINPVFEAVVDATSEAILNAMLAAETMTGANGFTMYALPHDRLLAVLRKYERIK